MKNLLVNIGCTVFLWILVACSGKTGKPLYQDPNRPVEQRIADLMKRMTLEEKVAQMCQYVGLEHMRAGEKNLTEKEIKNSDSQGFYKGLSSSDVAHMTEQGMIGSFLHVLDAEEANLLQELAQKSRLKIPLLIGIDAIHGNALNRGATVYPSPITLASTFDEKLIERLSRETALEMRATGSHWTFTPNLDVARDARWGRIGETFGEDPYLVTRFGVASVRGFQTDDFTGTDKVISCIKHLVAGSQPVNGSNAAPTDISERTLREVFFPPYQACVEAGAFTAMTAHNEINGVPCHGSKWLMTDVLRKEWGFDGFVVSDWMDIERMHDKHFIAESFKDAFFITVDAGMDMHMHGPLFLESVCELVKEKKLSEKRIDRSVYKILEAKFRLGLFENPFVDIAKSKELVFHPQHQATALEAARKSIVLLKNEGLLPLDATKYKRILVTGPNADNQSILGDWASEQPEENVVTVLEGIKMLAPESKVNFVDFGWNIRKMSTEKITEAVNEAEKSDLAIVVVGENSMRQFWDQKTCGENSDRIDITLMGLQQELIEKIYRTGTPTIVVLSNGRPLATEWISENVPALIEAWEPGSFGGQAVAEIIFGKVNPSGKLPITIPRHVGQIQSIYNHKPTQFFHKYVDDARGPLYEFGYGLSYTNYRYENIRTSQLEVFDNENFNVSIDVVNTGKMEGEEIVQMYIRDQYSTVTRPVKELKDFSRIKLLPGEKTTVSFTITPDKLAFYNLNMKRIVEKGAFDIMIGPSSKDEDLEKITIHVK